MSPTLRLSGTFLVALALGFAAASPTPRSPDFDDDLMDSSLGDMFREVEELMEDTQYKLQNAVKEIEAEKISSDRVAFEDLPPNFHNETITEKKIGNDTILIREQIDKKTDNRTGSTYISVVSELKSGNMDNVFLRNKNTTDIKVPFSFRRFRGAMHAARAGKTEPVNLN